MPSHVSTHFGYQVEPLIGTKILSSGNVRLIGLRQTGEKEFSVDAIWFITILRTEEWASHLYLAFNP